MKKTIAVLAFLFIFASSVYASDSKIQYTDYADQLNELGLFKGTDKGYELERVATRVEAAVMTVRMLGKEEEALSLNYTHPFTDVPSWADAYIGYLYHEGLTLGSSETTFSSYDSISFNQYLTFMLRALGYSDSDGDFVWNQAWSKALEVSLVDNDFYSLFASTNDLTRDEMVYISYHMLITEYKSQETTLLYEMLMDNRLDINLLSNVELAQLSESYYEWLTDNDAIESLDYSTGDFKLTVKITGEILNLTGVQLREDYDMFYILIDDGSRNQTIFFEANKSCSFSKSVSLSSYNVDETSVSFYEGYNSTKATYLTQIVSIDLEEIEDGYAIEVDETYYMNLDRYDEEGELLSKYLGSSTYINTEDPSIIALAADITEGLTNDLDKAFAVHQWLASNIYYDLDYAQTLDVKYTSIETLEMKRGVCENYAYLMAALLRSLDIPTKVVDGILNEYSWYDVDIYTDISNHAWNEIYIDGEWIIVDVTSDSLYEYSNGEYQSSSSSEPVRYPYFDIGIGAFSTTHLIKGDYE